jgi:hypothetical protein
VREKGKDRQRKREIQSKRSNGTTTIVEGKKIDRLLLRKKKGKENQLDGGGVRGFAGSIPDKQTQVPLTGSQWASFLQVQTFRQPKPNV